MPEDMALQEKADPQSETWGQGGIMESEHIFDRSYRCPNSVRGAS